MLKPVVNEKDTGKKSKIEDGSMMIEFEDNIGGSGFSILIEDAGGVCYAYIRDSSGEICGDVWMYNRLPAPCEKPWKSGGGPPYLNPAEYIRQEIGFSIPRSPSEFSVAWQSERNEIRALVSINGTVVAKIAPGERPGFSLLAGKKGPLAKPLEI